MRYRAAERITVMEWVALAVILLAFAASASLAVWVFIRLVWR